MLDDPFLQHREINKSPKKDDFFGAVFNFSSFEKKQQTKIKKTPFQKNKTSQFEARLEEVLEPTLSAKELIGKIVRTALEVEFGPSFTMTPGFARMVDTIAETIVTNPELRRQALAIASIYISRKLGPRETIKQ
ncbi:MAG: hypothetical protein NT099_04325 [Candidatus Saganbacteria bacterium]|nr:hypothetical protein [Candidatus Saganbacteria bacterium]